jgi:serine/threonine protein kinase
MDTISLFKTYHQHSVNILHDALSHEFPQLMIQMSLKNKQFLPNYSNFLATSSNLSLLLSQIIHLIQNNASQKELRDFMKVFHLPLGLRHQLVQFISQKLIGHDDGQILLDSIYISSPDLVTLSSPLIIITSQTVSDIPTHPSLPPSLIPSPNQFKVFHSKWNCFLTVQKSPPILHEQHFHKIVSRCQQWISLGSHPNLVSGYFCRLDSLTKHHLLFFYETLEPTPPLTLHHLLFSHNEMKQRRTMMPTMIMTTEESVQEKILSQVHGVFHLMMSLCHGVEVCHNKGLPHLNLTPENILLVKRGICSSDKNNSRPSEPFYHSVISSLCLSDLDHLPGTPFSFSLLSHLLIESVYSAPETSRCSLFTTSNSQLFPLDIFALGMIFLDLIRGRSLLSSSSSCSCERNMNLNKNLFPSLVDWDQTAKSELIDWAFSESLLPKRRIYPLMSLIDNCLNENPMNRPTIRSLLDHLSEAYHQFITSSNQSEPLDSLLTSLPPPSLSLESSSNLSNLAMSEFELGQIENARNHWILSLANHPSNVEVIWNLNLFRWRIGEITPLEFIEILCQHMCQYHSDYGLMMPSTQTLTPTRSSPSPSPQVTLLQNFIKQIQQESCLSLTPTHHFPFTSTFLSSLECLNLSKTFAEFQNPFTLKLESQLGSYSLSYDIERNKFSEKKFQNINSLYRNSSSCLHLSSMILCLDPNSETITLLESSTDHESSYSFSIGEILNFESTTFFVERPIGSDFVNMNPETTYALVFILLEGRWATATDLESCGGDDLFNGHGHGGGHGGDDDVSSSEQNNYQLESNDSQSTPSDQQDQHMTPAPPKRHYVLVVGALDSSYHIHDQGSFQVIALVDILGISFDQRPYGMKLLETNTLCVCGSGGLLASITLPETFRKHMPIRVTHINTDEYLIAANSSNNCENIFTSSSSSLSSCHPIDSTIIDISSSSRTHTLVSGDSLGYLCLWQQQHSMDLNSSSYKIVGFPFQVGCRIQKVVHSLENMSTLVSTDWKLLLIQVHTDSVIPTLYLQTVLDFTIPSSPSHCHDFMSSPPRYIPQFYGEVIHVWKLTSTATYNQHGLNRFENAHRVKDDQVYDSMVDEEASCSLNSMESVGQGDANQAHQVSLSVEFLIFPNPNAIVKRSNRCQFRYQPIDSHLTLVKKKKEIRSLNERIFHLINDDEHEAALSVIQTERRKRGQEDFLYSNDLLTWFLSISEKVHLDVKCSPNLDSSISSDPSERGSESQSERGREDLSHQASEPCVRFVSIEGLETCQQSPSTSSEIDLLSEISASMKTNVECPIFPTAISSTSSLVAISPISKISHSSPTNHNIVTSFSYTSFPVIWMIDTQTLKLLYTIENHQLTSAHQYEEVLNLYYPNRRDGGGGLSSAPRVSTLKFSKSGRYLIIAQSYPNSSLVSIWCTSTRSCVGQLPLREKDVVDVRWNNSDTLISIFYSDDKFLNFFLDWPLVTVVPQLSFPSSLSSWGCGRPPCTNTLSLSLLDTLVLSENQDSLIASLIGSNTSYNANTKSLESDPSLSNICPSSQFFDHLYETEYSWLWTQETVHSSPTHHQIYQTFIDTSAKKWIIDELRAWMDSDLSNYYLRMNRSPQLIHSSTFPSSSSSLSQPSKVCLIVGGPSIGKSYLIEKIASQFGDRTVARIRIPRTMLLNSTPNSVAFHMVLILSHQLRDTFGFNYLKIVIRELSNQLKMIKKKYTRERQPPLVPNGPGGGGGGVGHTSRGGRKHHRHFSTASSSLGSIDLNHHDDDQQDYETLLWFTSQTLRHTSSDESEYFSSSLTSIVPSISALPIHLIFKCFIEIPLLELPSPVKSYAIFVDGLDLRDSSTTKNHYQLVLHLLTHSTPSWCKIILTSRVTIPFLPYLIAGGNGPSINTVMINLNDENHLTEDFYQLANHLLVWKRYQGDLQRGAELLFPALDFSMRNCIHLYEMIPIDCDLSQLQQLLHFFDPVHLTFQEEFSSPSTEVCLSVCLSLSPSQSLPLTHSFAF